MGNWASDFGDFEGRVWLNCAHQGPLPAVAVGAAMEAIEWKKSPHRMEFGEFFKLPEALRRVLADLVGAELDEIALGNSATFGIQILVHGLSWKEGDEILVVEGDFPASVVPWRVLESRGVRVKLIRPDGPCLSVHDVERCVTDRTRLLCATWVASYSGWVLDLGAIGEVARANGILTVLNASQGLGSLALDVRELPIDALTCCGFKWLLGPYGTGFAWLSRVLLDQLQQYQVYWLSMQNPDCDSPRLDYQITDIRGARAFDVFGTANFLNFMPWLASIEYLLEQGIEEIEGHDRALVSRLVKGLERAEYELMSPVEQTQGSAIVAFSHREAERNRAVHAYLAQRGFDLCLRDGLLRASPHLYNTEEDIDRLLETLCQR